MELRSVIMDEAAVGRSLVLYALLAALNLLLCAAVDVAAAGLLFRVCPRRQWYLLAGSVLLALAVGALRPFAFAQSLQWVQMWNLVSTLLPFLLALLLYPLRAVWKALLACLGYEFVAALKYVILLLFFHYDNDNVNDPQELLVELGLNMAVLLLLVVLHFR